MKQKGLAPILIILLVAAVISGFLLYQKYSKPISVSQQDNQLQQTIQPSTTPTINPTASNSTSLPSLSPSIIVINTTDWQTYTNTKYKYSLQLPSDMKLIEENIMQDSATERTTIQSVDYQEDESSCKGGCSFPVIKGWILNIRVQSKWQYGFDRDFFKESPPLRLPGILSEVEQDNNGIHMLVTNRTRVDLPDMGNSAWYCDFVSKNNWYRITYTTAKANQSISKNYFNQILSTFKFLP